MNTRQILLVTAIIMTIMIIVTFAAGHANDGDYKSAPAPVSDVGAEEADGAQGAVIKITYPASRESVLETLAGNIVLACKLPELQQAASLTERQCRTQVLAKQDACKAKARVRIPDRIIQSKGQFAGELKTYLDCLIPPTSSAAPEFSGPDVLA